MVRCLVAFLSGTKATHGCNFGFFMITKADRWSLHHKKIISKSTLVPLGSFGEFLIVADLPQNYLSIVADTSKVKTKIMSHNNAFCFQSYLSYLG